MKTFSLLICVLVAGGAASFAVASPSPGKGRPAETTAQTTTTGHGGGHAGKVVLCHRTHSRKHPYVKVLVGGNAVRAHLRRGDVEPAADGSCPKPPVTPPTTTTETTTSP
jgi:hypothetical protein